MKIRKIKQERRDILEKRNLMVNKSVTQVYRLPRWELVVHKIGMERDEAKEVSGLD
jgi:hypothetical protein